MAYVAMSAPVALVTGVTTSVGKAVVRRLAFSGYKVAAADQCPEGVNEVATDSKKVGGNVVGFAVDIGNREHRRDLVSRVVSEMGQLDSLVVVPPDNDVRGDIINTEADQFRKLFNDRLTLPFRLTQDALPPLQSSNCTFWNASVVYLTSCAGYTPGVDMGLFSVASIGVLSLTKSVAISAARLGVRVNSVCLGMVEGDGSGGLWDSKAPGETLNQLQSMIPLGRLGRTCDAAFLVEFLISDRARYITGENCVLNGGVSFRL